MVSASRAVPVTTRQHKARIHQIVAYLWLRGSLGSLGWGSLDGNRHGEGLLCCLGYLLGRGLL